MNKRTLSVVFLAISAVLGLLVAEILLIDRPRAPVISGEKRFFERPEGILDKETGLLWTLPRPASGRRASGDHGLYDRKAAAGICAGHGAGKGKAPGDWRLPSLEELMQIAHCGPELKRCGVVLTREQKATCLRRRPGRPSWSFWTGEQARRCRDAKGRRPYCARAVRIFRGDCGEYGAVTGMRSLTSRLRVVCVMNKGKQ